MSSPQDQATEHPTRLRIVDAAAALFSRQGYAATGITSVLDAAGAPSGSLYHFFPGGKEDLGAAAIRASGDVYRQLVDLFFPEGVDVVAATEAFFAGAGELLRETGFTDACPIATITLETASASEPMRIASSESFESWLDIVQQRFAESGIARKRARELAVELFCAVEGAFLLCRASRSTEAMEVTGRSSAAAVRAALPSRRRRSRA